MAKKSRRKTKRRTTKRRTSRRAAVKRLYRSGRDKILGGVCGGLAEYLNVDPVLIRLLWVIFSLVYGVGVLAYILAWIVIPRNPKHKW
jgi:phage shock protein C